MCIRFNSIHFSDQSDSITVNQSASEARARDANRENALTAKIYIQVIAIFQNIYRYRGQFNFFYNGIKCSFEYIYSKLPKTRKLI